LIPFHDLILYSNWDVILFFWYTYFTNFSSCCIEISCIFLKIFPNFPEKSLKKNKIKKTSISRKVAHLFIYSKKRHLKCHPKIYKLLKKLKSYLNKWIFKKLWKKLRGWQINIQERSRKKMRKIIQDWHHRGFFSPNISKRKLQSHTTSRAISLLKIV
jgi:hypothetical protein